MNVRCWLNNCRRQQESIALIIAGVCPEPDQRRANDHLQHCAGCRAYFRELTQITGDLARLKKSGAQAAPRAELRARWTDEILSDTSAREVGTTERILIQPSIGSHRIAQIVRKLGLLPLRHSEWGRGPGRGGAHGENRGQSQAAPRPDWLPAPPPWLAWGVAMAACEVLALITGYRHGRSEPQDPLENAKIIRETLAMFPHRVESIVEDQHGMNLILSDRDDVPTSAPLYVQVCDGKQCSSFLTFSGQEITVDGQKITVLEDAHGGVILTGNEFVWSNSDRTEAGNHWQVEAKILSSEVM